MSKGKENNRYFLAVSLKITVTDDWQTLTLKAQIPQNGQPHSNSSSAICRQIV